MVSTKVSSMLEKRKNKIFLTFLTAFILIQPVPVASTFMYTPEVKELFTNENYTRIILDFPPFLYQPEK